MTYSSSRFLVFLYKVVFCPLLALILISVLTSIIRNFFFDLHIYSGKPLIIISTLLGMIFLIFINIFIAFRLKDVVFTEKGIITDKTEYCWNNIKTVRFLYISPTFVIFRIKEDPIYKTILTIIPISKYGKIKQNVKKWQQIGDARGCTK